MSITTTITNEYNTNDVNLCLLKMNNRNDNNNNLNITTSSTTSSSSSITTNRQRSHSTGSNCSTSSNCNNNVDFDNNNNNINNMYYSSSLPINTSASSCSSIVNDDNHVYNRSRNRSTSLVNNNNYKYNPNEYLEYVNLDQNDHVHEQLQQQPTPEIKITQSTSPAATSNYDFPKPTGGMIKLNVGGVFYYTSMTTLCYDSNSMFSLMFSGRFPIQKEEDGSIFIDRDGTHFHYILNWLRNGQLPTIRDEQVKEYLMMEARFYQITSLIDHLAQPSSNYENPNKFTQKDIITLLNQSSLPIQLASADLSGLDLSGLNFRGANLRFANLEGSSLKYCNLAEANLQDANLKRCDLRYSDLSHGNLQRVQLQNSQLQYSTAISCNFSDAELCESSLQNADFQNSLLSGANLQSANLQDINLNGSKLQGTSLYKAVNVQRAKGLKR